MKDSANIKFVSTGIQAIKWLKDGKKVLSLIKSENGRKVWQQNFLIEHLLDEDYEVTEQTLEKEELMFKEPMKV